MLNLSILLEDSAKRYPEKAAFIFMETTLNYSDINEASNKVANGLRNIDIHAGDKIALSCLNLPYFPILYFAILKVGAVVVPLSVLLKKEEIVHHLNDSDAKAYLCFTGTADLPMGREGYTGFQNAPHCKHFYLITPDPSDPSPIKGIPTLASLMHQQSSKGSSFPTTASDTAVIVYTSGTTGKPKGAELTHSNLLQNAIVSADICQAVHQDVSLIVLPLFHIFAMTCLMNSGIYRGITQVLVPRFEAKSVLDLMQKHQVTIFAGVPTMYWALLNLECDAKQLQNISKILRMCVSGGASLPVAVLEGFEEKFKVPILEGYGMSEGSPVVTFNQIDLGRKPGSIGKAVWGVEVKLVDENDIEVPIGTKGELLYRGHNVMKGYYKQNEANLKALRGGWMHSGDVAIKDEDGFYYIVDRTKDMILRGGLNVYPREVEEVMITHEAVSLVAVIGVPHEKLGEEVKAFVVLKAGETINETNLISWIKTKIAAYKYPRYIQFLDALPMSATGKILKKELRKM